MKITESTPKTFKKIKIEDQVEKSIEKLKREIEIESMEIERERTEIEKEWKEIRDMEEGDPIYEEIKSKLNKQDLHLIRRQIDNIERIRSLSLLIKIVKEKHRSEPQGIEKIRRELEYNINCMHFKEFEKNEIKMEIDSKSFLHELEKMELEIEKESKLLEGFEKVEIDSKSFLHELEGMKLDIEEELNLLEEFEKVQEEFEVLGLITEKKFESIEKEICLEKKEIEEMMIITSGNVFTFNLNQTM
jgi:hypothetical protein